MDDGEVGINRGVVPKLEGTFHTFSNQDVSEIDAGLLQGEVGELSDPIDL